MVMDLYMHLTMMIEKKQPIDCTYCNNQGEIDITEDVIKDLEQTTVLQ